MNTNHSPNGQPHDDEAAKVTAYALGQLHEAEAAEVEQLLADPSQEALRQQVRELKQLAPALAETRQAGALAPSASLRSALEQHLNNSQPISLAEPAPARWNRKLLGLGIALSIAGVAIALLMPPGRQLQLALSPPPEATLAPADPLTRYDHAAPPVVTTGVRPADMTLLSKDGGQTNHYYEYAAPGPQTVDSLSTAADSGPRNRGGISLSQLGAGGSVTSTSPASGGAEGGSVAGASAGASYANESRAEGLKVAAPQTSPADFDGFQKGRANGPGQPQSPGDQTKSLGMMVTPRIILQEESEALGQAVENGKQATFRRESERYWRFVPADRYGDGEQYELPPENAFREAREAPLSTFSIDVDTASYANVRRFLMSGRLPPPAAVRIEELLNYFSYRYPQPAGDEPFSVNLESAECPWQPGHLLLRVGLKGKEVHRAERPASNLVFLVDVSGSMSDENKLPLLKTSLAMMAAEFKHSDRVSIVTYAGDAGTKLDSARGDDKEPLRRVIDALNAGGSTHGSAGIQMAYDLAKKNFITGGVNRVIWATDGDLNVGVTDDNALVTLIKEKAASGVFLTVLGVGEGNLKDAKLEKLADNGNGVYAYLDSVKEARKVLVEQMSGSLVTIAKDVKLQIEFNPAEVAAYRLIGYENRVLAARDFADDKKDAGEIGAGHTVTALYELVLAGGNAEKPSDPETELKYQKPSKPVAVEKPKTGELSDAAKSGELLTLKLRYKQPDAERSVLREFPLKEKGGRFGSASPDFQFASAVAQFGMLLRGSQHRGSSAYSSISETAAATIGDDPQGLRAEFVDLVRKAERIGK